MVGFQKGEKVLVKYGSPGKWLEGTYDSIAWRTTKKKVRGEVVRERVDIGHYVFIPVHGEEQKIQVLLGDVKPVD